MYAMIKARHCCNAGNIKVNIITKGGKQNVMLRCVKKTLTKLIKVQADRGCAAVAFFGGSEGGVLKKRL